MAPISPTLDNMGLRVWQEHQPLWCAWPNGVSVASEPQDSDGLCFISPVQTFTFPLPASVICRKMLITPQISVISTSQFS